MFPRSSILSMRSGSLEPDCSSPPGKFEPPTRAASGFRPWPRKSASDLSILFSGSTSLIGNKVSVPCLVCSTLRPRGGLLWSRLTSPTSSPPPCDGASSKQSRRCALSSTLMSVRSTPASSVQALDFEDSRLLIPRVRLVSASCLSDQCFASGFLQIPPRDGHPCRAANSSPCRACSGLQP
jgi:hypothetical protein